MWLQNKKSGQWKKGFMKGLIPLLIIAWVFSGWPRIFNFPPRTQTVFAAAYDATIEVLGGGGGGGVIAGKSGGGGGGGEYRRCTETLSVQSYTVTVGAGGSEDGSPTLETDSTFSGSGITLTADGGDGTTSDVAGSAGTGGVSTNCDTAVANYNGGTPGAGVAQDFGGGGGGGAGYGGKGGNGASATSTAGGGGGEGGSETAAGANASGTTGGSGGGGGDGGNSTTTDANGSPGTGGTPATYQIVGGGGGGGSGAPTNRVGGACGAPGAGSGGGEVTGAGNGCRGEVRVIYVDSEIAATGGTETTSGIYRIHTFTANGTFQVTALAATFTQNDFEWYVDEATVTLTDPWSTGSVDIAENTVLTQLPATYRPLVSGDKIRIQMSITVTNTLAAGGQAFQLEYTASEDCTTAGGWAVVGVIGSGTIWRFYDNTSLTDGIDQVNQILTADVVADYVESNDTQTNPYQVTTTNDMEWDFAVENNGATANTTYCFRMALADGTALNTYNSDSYPKLTTAPDTADLMRHGRIFQNGSETGFFWAN